MKTTGNSSPLAACSVHQGHRIVVGRQTVHIGDQRLFGEELVKRLLIFERVLE